MEEAGVMQRVSPERPSLAVATSGAPKLLDRVRQTIRAKHYSRRTESAYVDWIRRYILFHQKRHPSEMGAPEIAAFLTWLATNRRVSASTQNQSLSALLFLYRDVLHIEIGPIENVPRARMPVRVPVVLSRDEVARIMKHLDGVTWMMVALLYGAGLRLQECLELRVKDIDRERRQIVIRRGKGQKDRPTVLPTAVVEPLARHLEAVKRQHEAISREGWAESCCPSRSTANTRTHPPNGVGSSCFPRLGSVPIRDGGHRRGFTCTNPSCRKPSRTRRGRPRSRSVSAHTLSGTRLRHTCSRMATTSGRCRSCSGTRTSARRWCTRTCSIAVRSACAVLSTDSDVGERGWPRTVAANQAHGRPDRRSKFVDLQRLVVPRW